MIQITELPELQTDIKHNSQFNKNLQALEYTDNDRYKIQLISNYLEKINGINLILNSSPTIENKGIFAEIDKIGILVKNEIRQNISLLKKIEEENQKLIINKQHFSSLKYGNERKYSELKRSSSCYSLKEPIKQYSLNYKKIDNKKIRVDVNSEINRLEETISILNLKNNKNKEKNKSKKAEINSFRLKSQLNIYKLKKIKSSASVEDENQSKINEQIKHLTFNDSNYKTTIKTKNKELLKLYNQFEISIIENEKSKLSKMSIKSHIKQELEKLLIKEKFIIENNKKEMENLFLSFKDKLQYSNNVKKSNYFEEQIKNYPQRLKKLKFLEDNSKKLLSKCDQKSITSLISSIIFNIKSNKGLKGSESNLQYQILKLENSTSELEFIVNLLEQQGIIDNENERKEEIKILFDEVKLFDRYQYDFNYYRLNEFLNNFLGVVKKFKHIEFVNASNDLLYKLFFDSLDYYKSSIKSSVINPQSNAFMVKRASRVLGKGFLSKIKNIGSAQISDDNLDFSKKISHIVNQSQIYYNKHGLYDNVSQIKSLSQSLILN